MVAYSYRQRFVAGCFILTALTVPSMAAEPPGFQTPFGIELGAKLPDALYQPPTFEKDESAVSYFVSQFNSKKGIPKASPLFNNYSFQIITNTRVVTGVSGSGDIAFKDGGEGFGLKFYSALKRKYPQLREGYLLSHSGYHKSLGWAKCPYNELFDRKGCVGAGTWVAPNGIRISVRAHLISPNKTTLYVDFELDDETIKRLGTAENTDLLEGM